MWQAHEAENQRGVHISNWKHRLIQISDSIGHPKRLPFPDNQVRNTRTHHSLSLNNFCCKSTSTHWILLSCCLRSARCALGSVRSLPEPKNTFQVTELRYTCVAITSHTFVASERHTAHTIRGSSVARLPQTHWAHYQFGKCFHLPQQPTRLVKCVWVRVRALNLILALFQRRAKSIRQRYEFSTAKQTISPKTENIFSIWRRFRNTCAVIAFDEWRNTSRSRLPFSWQEKWWVNVRARRHRRHTKRTNDQATIIRITRDDWCTRTTQEPSMANGIWSKRRWARIKCWPRSEWTNDHFTNLIFSKS